MLVLFGPLLRNLTDHDILSFTILTYFILRTKWIRLLLPQLANSLLWRFLLSHVLFFIIINFVIYFYLGTFNVVRSDMVSGCVFFIFVTPTCSRNVLDSDTVANKLVWRFRSEILELATLAAERRALHEWLQRISWFTPFKFFVKLVRISPWNIVRTQGKWTSLRLHIVHFRLCACYIIVS